MQNTRHRHSALFLAAIGGLTLSACGDTSGVDLRWRIVEVPGLQELAPEGYPISSPYVCASMGLDVLEWEVYQTSGKDSGKLVKRGQWNCFEPELADPMDRVQGPDLNAGDYLFQLTGLRKSQAPWHYAETSPYYESYVETSGVAARVLAHFEVREGERTDLGELLLPRPPECDDGVDNDGDLTTDQADIICSLSIDQGALASESGRNSLMPMTLEVSLFGGYKSLDLMRLGISHVALRAPNTLADCNGVHASTLLPMVPGEFSGCKEGELRHLREHPCVILPLEELDDPGSIQRDAGCWNFDFALGKFDENQGFVARSHTRRVTVEHPAPLGQVLLAPDFEYLDFPDTATSMWSMKLSPQWEPGGPEGDWLRGCTNFQHSDALSISSLRIALLDSNGDAQPELTMRLLERLSPSDPKHAAILDGASIDENGVLSLPCPLDVSSLAIGENIAWHGQYRVFMEAYGNSTLSPEHPPELCFQNTFSGHATPVFPSIANEVQLFRASEIPSQSCLECIPGAPATDSGCLIPYVCDPRGRCVQGE